MRGPNLTTPLLMLAFSVHMVKVVWEILHNLGKESCQFLANLPARMREVNPPILFLSVNTVVFAVNGKNVPRRRLRRAEIGSTPRIHILDFVPVILEVRFPVFPRHAPSNRWLNDFAVYTANGQRLETLLVSD